MKSCFMDLLCGFVGQYHLHVEGNLLNFTGLFYPPEILVMQCASFPVGWTPLGGLLVPSVPWHCSLYDKSVESPTTSIPTGLTFGDWSKYSVPSHP